MNRLIVPTSIVSVALLAACGHYKEKTDSWIGRAPADLIYAWGPPVAAADVDANRKVVSYRYVFGLGDLPIERCEVIFRIVDDRIENASVYGDTAGCDALLIGKPKGK